MVPARVERWFFEILIANMSTNMSTSDAILSSEPVCSATVASPARRTTPTLSPGSRTTTPVDRILAPAVDRVSTPLTCVGFRKTDSKQSARIESALSKALGFKPGVGGRSWSEECETRPLSAETFQKLSAISARAFAGAWAIILSRYLGEQEVLFNCGIQGHDPRTLLYRIDGNEPAADLLKRDGEPVTEGIPPDTTVHVGRLETAEQALSVSVTQDCLEVRYQRALFEKETIRRLANHYATLLESLAATPTARIRDLQMLGAEERTQILDEWGRGKAVLWSGETIIDLVRAQAERTPHAVALLAGEGDEHLTYAQLHQQTEAVAAFLAENGAGHGSAVGVLLPRSLDIVVALLGIWRAGVTFVPLDSSYPPERTAFMLKDAKVQAVLTNAVLSESLPRNTDVKILQLDHKHPVAKAPDVAIKPSGIAYVIYTSGSTGQPKGVALTHASLARHIVAMRDYYNVTSADRHLHFSPFTFDASFEQLLPPLVAGGSVVIRGERLWDHEEFAAKAAKFELTMVDLPMAYWHKLAHYATTAGSGFLPKRLRLFVAGGEAMSTDGLVAWQTGPLADRRLVNAYGPTEATITATACEASVYKLSEDLAGSVPIGRPLPGRSLFILDRNHNIVPARVPGEIYIGGELLAAGYLNRSELTAERFIASPFAAGERIYRTGDLGRFLEDGSIEFLGRADDQVKIRGFRVELGEIEGALRQHPGIRDTVVLARDAGTGQKRLVAYIVKNADGPGESELRRWLATRLPEFMLPSAFVFLDEFPLLPSGKVDRKSLPEPGAAAAVALDGASPKTPLELQLQLIFQRVLRRVGVPVNASFFELGGDSLQALELILQIEKDTGKRLPLETLFHAATVEALAHEIQEDSAAEWSTLLPLQRSGVLPPLYLVHTTPGDVLGYGNLIHHLGTAQPCFGFQAFGLKEPELAHTRIEEMAASSSPTVLTISAAGALGGSSLSRWLISFSRPARRSHRSS
jgi:amino acid adenylation domain-containing protein